MGTVNFEEKGMTFVAACFREFGGQTYFTGFFLIGLLYLWIRGTKKEKYFFGVLSLFLAATIYNPLLANTAIRVMHMSAEYYRFFWILPITFLMAYLCMKVTELPERRLGRWGICMFLVLILMFSGEPVVAGISEIQMPQNKYKVPNELISACESIHEDAKENKFPKSVFEYDYNTMVRQYDGTMRLTLDRDVYLMELGSNTVNTRNLSEEEVNNQRIIIQVIQNHNLEINPLVFMAALKATETEYLVISKSSEDVLAYLTNAGCVSFADTGAQVVFRSGDWGEE